MEMRNFNEIMRLDKALHQLAIYDVTKGMIVIPHSLDEAMSFQDKVANRFNYFKRLIQNGECTFNFIKWSVLQENGPFIQKKLDLDDPDFINKSLTMQEPKEPKEDTKEIQEEQKEEENNRRETQNYLKSLIGSLLPNLTADDKDNLVDDSGIKINLDPEFMGSYDASSLLDLDKHPEDKPKENPEENPKENPEDKKKRDKNDTED